MGCKMPALQDKQNKGKKTTTTKQMSRGVGRWAVSKLLDRVREWEPELPGLHKCGKGRIRGSPLVVTLSSSNTNAHAVETFLAFVRSNSFIY